MSIKKNVMLMAVVKKAATLESALRVEKMIYDGEPHLIDDLLLEMLEGWEAHPKIAGMVSELEDELMDIIRSQRHLRARGMGVAPLWKAPTVKVEGGCSRCGGTGIVEQYRHHNGGRCYKCGGTGR